MSDSITEKAIVTVSDKFLGTWSGKLIIAACILTYFLFAGGFIGQCNKNSKLQSVNQELVQQIIDLQPVIQENKTLHSQYVATNDKLDSLIKDKNDLDKIVKEQSIKLVAAYTTISELQDFDLDYQIIYDTVYVNNIGTISIKEKKFDTLNAWFDISGKVDSTSIHFNRIKFLDSLQFILTEKNNDYYKGYIKNFNPYSDIKRLEINIKPDQDNLTWYWYAIGGFVSGAAIIYFIK
jgi:hypothetical protein